MRRVEVGDEMHPHAFHRVMVERVAHHRRAEIRAADADIHHVADWFAGMAAPVAIVNRLDKALHVLEHVGDITLDVHAFHDQGGPHRCSQGGVQHGALFGEIDARTAEQVVAHAFQLGFVRQPYQMLHGVRCDAVFRVIEQQVAAAKRKPIKTVCILPECCTHVEAAHGLEVLFQGLPGGQMLERFHGRTRGGSAFKGIISARRNCQTGGRTAYLDGSG